MAALEESVAAAKKARDRKRHDEQVHTIDVGFVHTGDMKWRGGEFVWVCRDDCPHPSHEDQP